MATGGLTCVAVAVAVAVSVAVAIALLVEVGEALPVLATAVAVEEDLDGSSTLQRVIRTVVSNTGTVE